MGRKVWSISEVGAYFACTVHCFECVADSQFDCDGYATDLSKNMDMPEFRARQLSTAPANIVYSVRWVGMV